MKRFKKILSVFLVVAIILCSAPLNGFVGLELPDWLDFSIKAEALTEGIYTYTVTNGEATITGCDKSVSGDIVIPSTLGGYPVTSIGDEVFYNCESVRNVTIPDSIESIGDGAFRSCDSLQGIIIPDSVTSVGVYAFYYCYSLKNVTIGNSVTAILFRTFEGCSKLKSVTIGNSVTSIGSYAFLDCVSLTNITIPDSVLSIGEKSFGDCESLTSVTIGSGVESMGIMAFSYCYSLPGFVVDSNNKNFSNDENGVLYNKDKTELIQYPIGLELTEFTTPDSVKSIGQASFFGCDNLTKITIGDSVTSIYRAVFFDCDSLTSVTIGNGVTYIDEHTFYDCDGLISVELGNSVETIGEEAFINCDNLTSISIHDSVRRICKSAFHRCDSLTDVYYYGAKENLQKIYIYDNNMSFFRATKHFLGNYEFKVMDGSSTVIDDETKTIYGLEEGVYDLEGYVKYEGYELKYNSTAFGFGTGATVDLIKEGEVVDTYTIIIFGDINGDGYVDAFDVPDVMAFVDYNSQYGEGSPQELAADVNGDGYVDELDLFTVDLASTFAYTIKQSR